MSGKERIQGMDCVAHHNYRGAQPPSAATEESSQADESSTATPAVLLIPNQKLSQIHPDLLGNTVHLTKDEPVSSTESCAAPYGASSPFFFLFPALTHWTNIFRPRGGVN